MNEPIKHHYIPRFLLKPFCFNADLTNYCEKSSLKSLVKDIKEVFMTQNLYRDELNNADNPTQIENDLAKFESEVGSIIKKFRQETNIVLSFEEVEKLKVFFAIMGFRAKRISEIFSKAAPNELKEFYKNDNLPNLWKQNLKHLTNCRSLQEIKNNKYIDERLKFFMQRDIFGYFGTYFVLIERRGEFDFILSDCYPTVISGYNELIKTEQIMYSIFPISPSRCLLLAYDGVDGTPQKVLHLNKHIFSKPQINNNDKSFSFRVKKIYKHDVKFLNLKMIKETSDGFIYKDKFRIELND